MNDMTNRLNESGIIPNAVQESGFAAACGAAFDYAIAVPAGQIGGRLDFFI